MEKKNTTVIIILVTIILLLGGFIAYDKLYNKDALNCITEKEATNDNNNKLDNTTEDSDFYINFKKSYLSEEHSTIFSENDIFHTAQDHWEISKITLTTDAKLVFKTYSRLQEKHQSDTYTAAENIIDYAVMKTNGGYNVLYVLTNEGKVKKLNDDQLKNVEVVFDDLGLSNIAVIKRCDLETENEVE